MTTICSVCGCAVFGCAVLGHDYPREVTVHELAESLKSLPKRAPLISWPGVEAPMMLVPVPDQEDFSLDKQLALIERDGQFGLAILAETRGQLRALDISWQSGSGPVRCFVTRKHVRALVVGED